MNLKLKEDQRALIIGDVHACYDELMELVDKSGIELGKDIIISVGDLIDRGYRAYDVIKFFQQTPSTFSIMGNHEIKHLLKMNNNESLFNKHDFSGELQKLMLKDHEYKEIIDYISTLPLFINLALPNDKKYLIVHAGWHNGIKKIEVEFDINNRKPLSKDIKYMLGIGSQGREGFNNIGEPWFRSLKIDYTVISGHTKYKKVQTGSNNNIFGIDTGCYNGGKLSGLLLPAEKIIQVKAKKNYYQEILTERLDDVFLKNYSSLSWKDKEYLRKESKSLELLEKIDSEFIEIKSLYSYILHKAEEYKKSIGELTNAEKKELGLNWNSNNIFSKKLAHYIKLAFFNKFSLKDLYKYDIEEIQDLNRIIELS